MKRREALAAKAKDKKLEELRQNQKRWMDEMSNSANSPSTRLPQPRVFEIGGGNSETKQSFDRAIAPSAEVNHKGNANLNDILSENWISHKGSSNNSTGLNNHSGQFSCPACRAERMVSPHLMIPCGHSACERCIVERMERFRTCAKCQNPVQGHFPNMALQELIKNSAKNSTSNGGVSTENVLKHQQSELVIDSSLLDLDFDLDPSIMASKYGTQLQQLQSRCDLIHEELDNVLNEKSQCNQSLENSKSIVQESTREMQDIHDLMVKYEKRTVQLQQDIQTNQHNIAEKDILLQNLRERENNLKETLGQLIKRREKVKVIFTGIKSSVAPT